MSYKSNDNLQMFNDIEHIVLLKREWSVKELIPLIVSITYEWIYLIDN